MIDREKVKKGLDLCLTGEPSTCKDCPYDAECKKASGIGPSPLRMDALELLKKQEWISVKDRMPAETHSTFFKFYGTPKWRNAMWREESDHVLVAITFEDGSQFVTSGYTQDGKWSTGISKILQYTVTHWMQMPEPPEGVKQE